MENKKPVKLYFFVTFLLILVILFIGLNVKEYLSQKFPDNQIQQNETKLKKSTDQLSQGFAIVDLAIGVALVLVLLFAIVKIIMGKLRSV